MKTGIEIKNEFLNAVEKHFNDMPFYKTFAEDAKDIDEWYKDYLSKLSKSEKKILLKNNKSMSEFTECLYNCETK